MKIDARLGPDLNEAAFSARQLEDAGYDGGWSSEAGSDPFLPLAVAAPATRRLELGTKIAVAFARNPMVTALGANDLQKANPGRPIPWLGCPVRAHIEKGI